MQALFYMGTRHLVVREIPPPQPQPDEVLVKVTAAGICGSDLHGFLGRSKKRVPPLIMGHEFTGVIEQTGNAVGDLRPGLRVVINPIIVCRSCPLCRQGRSSICPNRRVIGIDQPGAFAEWVAVPQAQVYPLPDSIDDLSGSMIESLANAVHLFSCNLQGLIRRIAIIGAGTQGLLALLMARLVGVTEIFVSDVEPGRLEIAAHLGATMTIDARQQNPVETIRQATNGVGVDFSIEAVGHAATREHALDCLQPGGIAVFLGLAGAVSANLDCLAIVNRELQIRGTYAYSSFDFQRAIDLIGSGQIDVKPLLSPAPLAEGPALFSKLVDAPGRLVKVALIP